MTVMRRAILYLTRKRSRAVILLIVFVVMSVFSMVCLSISRATSAELRRLKENFASSFTMEIDFDALTPPLPDDFKGIEEEELAEAGQVEGLKACFVFHEYAIWADLEFRYGWYHYILDNPLEDMTQNDLNRNELFKKETTSYGCYNSDLHEFFRTGAFELVEGRHIQPDDKNKALISQDVAERNGLKLGDSFDTGILSFTPERWRYSQGIDMETYTANINEIVKETEWALYRYTDLEIVGIYKVNFTQVPSTYEYEGRTGYYTSEDQYAESVIFTDIYSSFQYNDIEISAADCVEPTGKNATPDFSQLTLFVENPEDMEQVIERAKQLSFYNEDYYNTSIDTDAYEASAKPLRQIQTVMIVLIIVSVIACVVIIWLVSSMWAKSRKKEMGILLALGNSRSKVLLQFFIELLIICIIALVIGAIVSAAILGPVGNAANAAVAPDPNADRFTYSYPDRWHLEFKVNSGEPVDLTYYLTALPVVITAGIMICASLISVAASSLRTMKLKPRDIFSKW